MISNLIVPVLNRYDLLQRMLDSIDYMIRDLLIIDNGGNLSHVKFPKTVLNSHVLSMPSNQGVSGSWNLGIKCFPHDNVWMFGSNDVVFGANALEKLSQARRDEITLTESFPHWQAFAVGDQAVQRLGLFDESIHPAFCEDVDYRIRAEHHGVPIRKIQIPIHHDNSSTIHSDGRLKTLNHRTHGSNDKYLRDKVARGDFSEGRWDLERRRANAWDVPPVE